MTNKRRVEILRTIAVKGISQIAPGDHTASKNYNLSHIILLTVWAQGLMCESPFTGNIIVLARLFFSVCDEIENPCQNGKFYAHARNCTAFYQCSNGILMPMACKNNTQFDSFNRTGCVHPWATNCSIRCFTTTLAPSKIPMSTVRKEDNTTLTTTTYNPGKPPTHKGNFVQGVQ